MPLQVGSSGPLVVAWQRIMLLRFAGYAKSSKGGPLKVDGYFGYDDREVQKQYQRNLHLPADRVNGVVSDWDLEKLGALKPPPPLPPRHACLTFRGTGGIVGLDFTSRVAQMCAGRVEEIPILYPASMGGIPVGAANDVRQPSGQKCVEIAVEMAVDWIRSNSRTFVLGSYSLGALAASRVRAELLPGGRLAEHADRYVAGFAIGNPARRFGHTFWLGAVPGGYGIADWHLPEAACTWDWCELVDPGDLYANCPGGDVGDVIRKVQAIVTNTEVSDPVGTARKMIPLLLQLLDEAGVDLPLSIPGMALGALAGLLAAFLPAIPEAMQGGETGAAVQAAILALKFFADSPPTADHISYDSRQAIPGRTYLELAAQHVNDWAGRKAVQL